MATVALRGLTRHYGSADAPAVRGLDLEVADGEVLVVVGPSGCGKSTTLRLIAGLDVPSSGAILVDGRDVAHVPPQDRDVAMVFQGYALYPHLTVRENIAFPLKMRGMARADRARKAEETAELLGLGKLLDRRPGELSGGERQRVAMGRAIVRQPKVFLFDEPLSNLDAALRAELRVELAALVRRFGTTSLYVTHDQVEAMTLGDRIAVLERGVLQQIGSPREIYEDPENEFVASFLGAPPMNIVPLERDGVRAKGHGLDIPVPAAITPAKLKVGFRPEHVALVAPGATAAGVHLDASVVATEPLGAETFVYLDAGGERVRARVRGFEAPARGAAVRATVNTAHLHWFDAETGKRCRPS